MYILYFTINSNAQSCRIKGELHLDYFCTVNILRISPTVEQYHHWQVLLCVREWFYDSVGNYDFYQMLSANQNQLFVMKVEYFPITFP